MQINFIAICISATLLVTNAIHFTSNYNASKANDSLAGDPVSLAIIVNNPIERKYHEALTQKFNIRKYQLKDTDYLPDPSKLNEIDDSIIYHKEPPSNVFDVPRITIDDYQFLQTRNFKLILINPSNLFKFCITQIFIDSETIKRVEQRKLPFCLNPSNKYPFYFDFYTSDFKPIILKANIYFFIQIYDGQQLVDHKIWPRQILTKVNPNYLRIQAIQARNCGRNYTNLTISNHQPHHLRVTLDLQQQNTQKGKLNQVIIPSQKTYKMTIMPKQKNIIITSRAQKLPDIVYPKLTLPIFCFNHLQIDHFYIGVLNSQRSILQIPLLVSSNSKETLIIKHIQIQSSCQTVQILGLQGNHQKVQPNIKHKVIARLIVHVNKQPQQKVHISLKIAYIVQNSPKQIFFTKNTFKYTQIRNPLSVANRFINVNTIKQLKRQQTQETSTDFGTYAFPIRNNLNIPISLNRVLIDQKIFRVTMIGNRKQYLYPNELRQQFLLQYIGPLDITISPLKFIMNLQFNGHLLIPIEIVLYDKTLQCVYNNIQQKCANLPIIDYGYFRNNATKIKQIYIRNWNPQDTIFRIKMLQNMVQNFGMNCSINLYGPYPSYQIGTRHMDGILYYDLKGKHSIVLTLALTPLENATSGQIMIPLGTDYQNLTPVIKFKIQNGTIALIPQVLRINSAYQRSIEYLNLVSTFSQPYKIRMTSVNLSNINILANNQPEIYQNQWVGLTVIYEPFVKGNFTEVCCDTDFAINYFINSLNNNMENKRYTYVTVKVMTTTELEANSTVIIDNKPPKIIEEENLIANIIQINNPQPYLIPFINTFTQPMKLSAFFIPKPLYQDSKSYMQSIKKTRKQKEDTYFCVNNGITVRHNFSPQLVKNIFNLNSIPQQITIQPLGGLQYYIGGSLGGTNKKTIYDPNSSMNQLSKYVIDTVEDGARICYKISTQKYIKQLIQTQILNDLAQNHTTQIFLQFVQKQMQYMSTPFHFHVYDQFYQGIKINLRKYCDKTNLQIFRFCKDTNILNQKLPSNFIVQPGEKSYIPIQASVVKQFLNNQEKESSLQKSNYNNAAMNNNIFGMSTYSQQMYLAIINNITKFQSHPLNIKITKPKISFQNLYNVIVNRQTKVAIFAVQKIAFNKNTYYSKQFTESDKKNIIKAMGRNNGNSMYQSMVAGGSISMNKNIDTFQQNAPKILPIILTEKDLKNQTLQTVKIFQIINTGEVDINITHIGFQNIQNTCQHSKGIKLVQEHRSNQKQQTQFKCTKPTIIKQGQAKNLTLFIKMNKDLLHELVNIKMYMYYGEKYYFNFLVVIKAPIMMNVKQRSYGKAFAFLLNVVSMVFLLLFVFMKIKESQIQDSMLSKTRSKSQAILFGQRKLYKTTKIMKKANYEKLGTKIQKKKRKLKPIPDSQIQAVKQQQDKKLKEFFNSSDQSQIPQRKNVIQQQNSNNNLLNDLRNQQKSNNVSLSQQSSIDLIEFNNRSSDNIEVEHVIGSSNQYYEQHDTSNHTGFNTTAEKTQETQEVHSQGSSDDQDFPDQDDGNYQMKGQKHKTGFNNFGWGKQTNKTKQQQKDSYYNVFWSENPLKKEKNDPFQWMQDYNWKNKNKR